MQTEVNYQEQAVQFAKKHGLKLAVNHSTYGKHFDDDKESRHIFNMTLSKDGKRYTFNFGQSIAAGNDVPTLYDVLACVQKYDIGTFENFCSEFGYDTDSRKAEKTYKSVAREYKNLLRVCGADVLEEMQEIN